MATQYWHFSGPWLSPYFSDFCSLRWCHWLVRAEVCPKQLLRPPSESLLCPGPLHDTSHLSTWPRSPVSLPPVHSYLGPLHDTSFLCTIHLCQAPPSLMALSHLCTGPVLTVTPFSAVGCPPICPAERAHQVSSGPVRSTIQGQGRAGPLGLIHTRSGQTESNPRAKQSHCLEPDPAAASQLSLPACVCYSLSVLF